MRYDYCELETLIEEYKSIFCVFNFYDDYFTIVKSSSSNHTYSIETKSKAFLTINAGGIGHNILYGFSKYSTLFHHLISKLSEYDFKFKYEMNC